MSDDVWQIIDLPELAETLDGPVSYKEFLHVESLSCGIYKLEAGSKDMQSAHDEDEVYYVIQGRGRLRIEGTERAVEPGMVLYVKAASEHTFFEIDEDMTLLVVFGAAPPRKR